MLTTYSLSTGRLVILVGTWCLKLLLTIPPRIIGAHLGMLKGHTVYL